MAEGNVLDQSFAADTSDLAEQYLDFQGTQFGSTFDVLIICNLIFHQDRVLLFRMKDDVKSWRSKIGVPLYRLCRENDENDVGQMLRSRIDQKMAPDVSVEEFGRVACRTQVGLDPGMLKSSREATALHTAVSPAAISESLWLRASLLWMVEDELELKPDNFVSQEVFWASEAETAQMASEDFFMGVKEDIEMAFSLRRRLLSPS